MAAVLITDSGCSRCASLWAMREPVTITSCSCCFFSLLVVGGDDDDDCCANATPPPPTTPSNHAETMTPEIFLMASSPLKVCYVTNCGEPPAKSQVAWKQRRRQCRAQFRLTPC